MTSIFTEVYDLIFKAIFWSPLLVLNQFLQILFFSMSLSSLVVFLLQSVKFYYAESVENIRIIKVISFLLFWYLKIWDLWINEMMIVSLFSAVTVCIYIFDCCANISDAHKQTNQQRKQIAFLLALTLNICGFFLIIYLTKLTDNEHIKM